LKIAATGCMQLARRISLDVIPFTDARRFAGGFETCV